MILSPISSFGSKEKKTITNAACTTSVTMVANIHPGPAWICSGVGILITSPSSPLCKAGKSGGEGGHAIFLGGPQRLSPTLHPSIHPFPIDAGKVLKGLRQPERSHEKTDMIRQCKDAIMLRKEKVSRSWMITRYALAPGQTR